MTNHTIQPENVKRFVNLNRPDGMKETQSSKSPEGKREGFKMKHGKTIIGIGICVLIFFLFLKTVEVQTATFYGRILAIEGTALQVKGNNGGISLFWVGYRTQLEPRAPFFGDRVKIEYVKDKLGRRAVTHLTVLGK